VTAGVVSDTEPLRRRGKLSRRHSAPAAAPVVNDLPSDADMSSNDSAPPPVISNVLMVEVDNVAHDPFKTTEEMKVGSA